MDVGLVPVVGVLHKGVGRAELGLELVCLVGCLLGNLLGCLLGCQPALWGCHELVASGNNLERNGLASK